MSNSSLVDYTLISPNKTVMKNKVNKKITIHHMAGNLTVEQCGKIFQPTSRKASANYGVGSDGRVGLYVDEKDRSWASSSSANDSQAVTIEVANDSTKDWHVSDKALNKTIDLCVDICQRNGIEKLNFTGNANGNLTAHRYFASTACVPITTEVLTQNGWQKISDVNVGESIACADLDNLRITFEEIYDKVEPYQNDTYTNNGLTATKDHRLVYRGQYEKQYRIDYYNKLLEKTGVYIPLAGYSNFEGLPISEDMEAFLIAIQADGSYMYEKNKNNEKKYYGVEFHFKKERKIQRIKDILERLHFPYKQTTQTNGTTKIRVYNFDDINVVNDLCEKYLHDKCFTWEWINLSPEQAKLFLNEILLWDGCVNAKRYSSRKNINLEIVNAIAAINGVGSRIVGNDVLFRDEPFITLSTTETKRNYRKHEKDVTLVTCVSVPTGIFLARQNGKTFIIGNCPGDYLYGKFSYIANEVNKKLTQSGFTQGWNKDDTGWWYVYSDGTYPVNTWKEIDGKQYYFGANGYLATDEYIKSSNYSNNKKLYYVNKDGAWDGRTYYWKSNNKGWWIENSKDKSYPKKKWLTIDGKKYYFDKNGYMVTGKVRIGLKTYKFRSDGSLIG